MDFGTFLYTMLAILCIDFFAQKMKTSEEVYFILSVTLLTTLLIPYLFGLSNPLLMYVKDAHQHILLKLIVVFILLDGLVRVNISSKP